MTTTESRQKRNHIKALKNKDNTMQNKTEVINTEYDYDCFPSDPSVVPSDVPASAGIVNSS